MVWFPFVVSGIRNVAFTSLAEAFPLVSRVVSRCISYCPSVVVMFAVSVAFVPTFPIAGVRVIIAVSACASGVRRVDVNMVVSMMSVSVSWVILFCFGFIGVFSLVTCMKIVNSCNAVWILNFILC